MIPSHWDTREVREVVLNAFLTKSSLRPCIMWLALLILILQTEKQALVKMKRATQASW